MMSPNGVTCLPAEFFSVRYCNVIWLIIWTFGYSNIYINILSASNQIEKKYSV